VRIRKVAVIILVQVVLVVAVLELGLRLTVPHVPGNYRTGLLYNRHPTLGWHHIPGSQAWLKTPEFTAHSRINSHGLRDIERPFVKPPNVQRVLVLGDSMAEATQVPLEETFPRLLEQRLTDRTPARRIDVINAGVVGYSTDQELLYVREHGVRYEPNLVVLTFFANDVVGNSRRLSAGLLPSKPFFELDGAEGLRLVGLTPRPVWVDSAETLTRIVLGRSVLASVVKTGVVDHVMGRVGSGPPVGPEVYLYARAIRPDWDEAWRITELLIEQVRQTAEAAGAAFMVVNAPVPYVVYPEIWDRLLSVHGLRLADWDLELPGRRLREISGRRGWHLLDPLPEFRRAAAGGARLHFAADGHWTAAGHQLVAELIAREIEERGLLSPRR
jgi:lysophospholipase L1-like esterase